MEHQVALPVHDGQLSVSTVFTVPVLQDYSLFHNDLFTQCCALVLSSLDPLLQLFFLILAYLLYFAHCIYLQDRECKPVIFILRQLLYIELLLLLPDTPSIFTHSFARKIEFMRGGIEEGLGAD